MVKERNHRRHTKHMSLCLLGLLWFLPQPTLPKPELLPDHKLEPGPDFRNRTYFDIDKTQRQRHFTDDILGDVGGDLRRLLRPRYPNRTGRLDLVSINLQSVRQVVFAGSEDVY